MSNVEIAFVCTLIFIWGSWFFRKYVKTYFGTKRRLGWLAQQHQNKKIRSALSILEALYKQTNSHQTAKLARIRRGITDDSFLYGEVDFLTLIALLTYCRPTKQDVFYDLGSGAGKAVFSAALCFPVCKSIGVELLPELNNIACKILTEYQKSDHAKNNLCHIQFEQADILHHPFEDATIIFINATAFKGDNWKRIENKLCALPVGVRVILTTHRLPSTFFKLIYSGTEVMSWGMNSAYVFEKIK